jgi:hypothetical protein
MVGHRHRNRAPRASSDNFGNAYQYANFLYEEAHRMGIKSFTRTHAAAIVGDMGQESGFDPASRPTIPRAGQGYGLIHWMNQGKPPHNRFANLQGFAAQRGTDWTDARTQMKFILHELYGTPDGPHGSGSEVGAGRALLRTKNIDSASSAVSTRYVRPLPGPTARYDARTNNARRVFAGIMGAHSNTQIASAEIPARPAPEPVEHPRRAHRALQTRQASLNPAEPSARRPRRQHFAELHQRTDAHEPARRPLRTATQTRRTRSHDYASQQHHHQHYAEGVTHTRSRRYSARHQVAANDQFRSLADSFGDFFRQQAAMNDLAIKPQRPTRTARSHAPAFSEPFTG